MAHSCPECGCTCYCGGDIDDILLEDPEAEADCTCCVSRGDDDLEDPYEDYIEGYGEDEP